MSVSDIGKLKSAKELAVNLGIDEAEPDDGAILAQDFGMSSAPPVPEERSLEIIEGEILFYKRQAGSSIIEIGRRLNEAKAQLRHGEWLPWLREKVDISERSARDFMRIAREYSKSAEIADLGAVKALALLDLKDSEREQFVSEKHVVDGVEKSVADMTAKELKKAIEERDAACRNMEAMKARAEVAEQSREKMEQDMRHLKELTQRAREAEEQKAAALQRAQTELDELRNKPVDVAVEVRDASEEQIAEARAAGQAEAEKKHKAELAAKEDQLKKARDDLKKAREEAKAANINLRTAEQEAKAARKKADEAGKMARINSNQNMVKFTVLFQQAQDTVNQMAEAVKAEPPANQEKMRNALNALADAIRKAATA